MSHFVNLESGSHVHADDLHLCLDHMYTPRKKEIPNLDHMYTQTVNILERFNVLITFGHKWDHFEHKLGFL